MLGAVVLGVSVVSAMWVPGAAMAQHVKLGSEDAVPTGASEAKSAPLPTRPPRDEKSAFDKLKAPRAGGATAGDGGDAEGSDEPEEGLVDGGPTAKTRALKAGGVEGAQGEEGQAEQGGRKGATGAVPQPNDHGVSVVPPPEAKGGAALPDLTAGPRAVQVEVKKLALPRHTVAELDAAWDRRLAFAQQDAWDASLRTLNEIAEIRRDLGITNLFNHSAALIRESTLLREKGRYEVSFAVADAAVMLSPDMTFAYLSRARARLALGLHNVLPALIDVRDAAQATFYSFRATRFFASVSLFVWVVAVYVLGASVALFGLIRYGGCAIHDFRRFFPPAVLKWQAASLLGLLLAVPLLALGSLALTITVPLAGLWVYMNRGERAASLIATLGLLLTLPAVSAIMTLEGDEAAMSEDLYVFAVESGPSVTRARVSALAAEGKSDDALVYATAALALKREGRLTDAEAIYAAAVSRFADDVTLRVNYANLLVAQQNFVEAERQYGEALRLAPRDFYAHYNLSQLYKIRFGEDAKYKEQAARELDAARLRDDVLVERFVFAQDPQINRYVIDRIPQSGELLGRLFAGFDPFGPRARALWQLTFGGVSYAAFALITLVLLLCAWFVNARRGVLQPARVCNSCGAAASLYTNPEMPNDDVCGHCFHLFVEGDVADPQIRLRKEAEITGRDARLVWGRRLLTVVPGGPSLFDGNAVTGSLLLFIAALALVGHYVAPVFAADTIAPGVSLTASRTALLSVTLVCVYIANLIHLTAAER